MTYIAVLGCGVVGSGAVEVVAKNKATIENRVSDRIEVKYILDLLDFPDSPWGDRHVKDFSLIENDPTIEVVVETMGGVGAAYDFSKRCLQKGKHVVTSNKELVATHGAELLALAREKGVNYLFEASVGGGVPIIKSINQCLAANEITEIYGILNGTTNYILTRMAREGADFAAVLREAQALGYAEADPTADIEGIDVQRKICILASLAFGRHLYPRYVPASGISKITHEDIEAAAACGRVIKLLGRAVRGEDGKISAHVSAYMVPRENQLATVDDVFNGIVVSGNAIGDVMFYGRGAGKLPTASAVMADVIDAIKHRDRRLWIDWEDAGAEIAADADLLKSEMYIRVGIPAGMNAITCMRTLTGLLGEGVRPIYIDNENPTAFLLPEMGQNQLENIIAYLENENIRVQNSVRLL